MSSCRERKPLDKAEGQQGAAAEAAAPLRADSRILCVGDSTSACRCRGGRPDTTRLAPLHRGENAQMQRRLCGGGEREGREVPEEKSKGAARSGSKPEKASRAGKALCVTRAWATGMRCASARAAGTQPAGRGEIQSLATGVREAGSG